MCCNILQKYPQLLWQLLATSAGGQEAALLLQKYFLFLLGVITFVLLSQG